MTTPAETCLHCRQPLDPDDAPEDGRKLHRDACADLYDAERAADQGDNLCDAERDAGMMRGQS